MNSDQEDFVRGSGNVFRDFGVPDADRHQLKALLASAIIKLLDEQGLSVRRAQAVTGIAAADFSRIRRADLQRFSLDRLVLVAGRLGAKVEMSVRRPRTRNARKARLPENKAGQETIRALPGQTALDRRPRRHATELT